jgi:hypothetical protein
LSEKKYLLGFVFAGYIPIALNELFCISGIGLLLLSVAVCIVFLPLPVYLLDKAFVTLLSTNRKVQ